MVSSYPRTGNTWYDLSGNNNSTLINGPTFDIGNGGNIVFDGTNDYVQTSKQFFTGSTFSVLFWINVNSFGPKVYMNVAIGNCDVGHIGTEFGPTLNYQGYQNTFSAGIAMSTGVNAIGTVKRNFSGNTWYYYASVYDGNLITNDNRLKIWINAIQYPLVFDDTVPAAAADVGVNATIGGSVTENVYFSSLNGRLSMMTIYNRALSPTEILQNYNTTKGRFNLS